jgi:hypothetical protein
VQKALEHSVLPLIETLIGERNKPEKTIHVGAITAAAGDESLLNLLIVSVNKLQDTVERFSTSIEQKLIQPKPAEVKPAPQAQAPATPPAPQAPAQAKPAEVKPPEVKPAPAPQAQAPAKPE